MESINNTEGFRNSNEFKEFLETKEHFTRTLETLEEHARIKYYRNHLNASTLVKKAT